MSKMKMSTLLQVLLNVKNTIHHNLRLDPKKLMEYIFLLPL